MVCQKGSNYLVGRHYLLSRQLAVNLKPSHCSSILGSSYLLGQPGLENRSIFQECKELAERFQKDNSGQASRGHSRSQLWHPRCSNAPPCMDQYQWYQLLSFSNNKDREDSRGNLLHSARLLSSCTSQEGITELPCMMWGSSGRSRILLF